MPERQIFSIIHPHSLVEGLLAGEEPQYGDQMVIFLTRERDLMDTVEKELRDLTSEIKNQVKQGSLSTDEYLKRLRMKKEQGNEAGLNLMVAGYIIIAAEKAGGGAFLLRYNADEFGVYILVVTSKENGKKLDLKKLIDDLILPAMREAMSNTGLREG